MRDPKYSRYVIDRPVETEDLELRLISEIKQPDIDYRIILVIIRGDGPGMF